MTRHDVTVAILALTACGGQTSGNAPDAAGPVSAQDASSETGGEAGVPTPVVHSMFLAVLGPSGCMPQMLVADAQGLVSCTVFVVPAAGAGCDASAGLTPAPPGAADAVRRSGVSSSSSVCMLPQLPEGAWVNGTCASSTEPGWCYQRAPASGTCPQRIVFSEGSPPVGAEVLVGCE